MFGLKAKRNRAHNELSLKGNVISVKLSGHQGSQLSMQTLKDFRRIVQEANQNHIKIFVIVDLTEIELQDIQTSARLAIKEALKQPFEAIAAFGPPELAELAMYLMSETDVEQKARFFTTKRSATRWIQANQHQNNKRFRALLLAAAIVLGVAILTFLGWSFSFPLLSRLAPTFKPINPMTTISLVILSFGLYGVWRKDTRIMTASSLGLMIFGAFALFPNNFGFDYWLFGNRLKELAATGIRVEISDSSAVTLIGIGILLIMQKVRHNPIPFIYVSISLTLFMFAAFNIFGTMYAPSFIYNIGPNFAMPIPFALAVAATLIVLGMDIIEFNWGRDISNISRISWLIMSSLVIIQFATYGGWLLTASRITDIALTNYKNRINDINSDVVTRINAYIDELHGFKALFASSNYIDQGEFETYYKNSRITQNYPGILTSAYVSRIETKDLPAFVAQRRSDSSLAIGYNKDFSIKQQSNKNVHYIASYVVGSQYQSTLGTDYADSPERANVYAEAAKTSELASSGTIYIPAEKTNGFFITVPVKNTGQAGNGSQINGFVNAAFRYDRLFSNIFESHHLSDKININVTDSTDGSIIFSSNNIKKSSAPLFSNTIPVKIANHNWNVEVKVPTDFGVDNTQKALPYVVLAGGQLLAVLVVLIFIMQNGARRRAVMLAETITEDLKNERDRAINSEKRSEVMLTSIADGLIILDENLDIIRVNDTSAKLLGMQPHEMVGKHFDKVLHAISSKDEPIPSANRDILHALTQKRTTRGELKYQRKNGTYFDAQYTCAPIIIQNKVTGVVEIFRDITQEKILDRAKTDFVSLASHQLRTPLSAIKWLSEMLLGGDLGKLSKTQKDNIKEISRGNERMIELVNALLNVSRLEVGKLKNEPVDISVQEVADSVKTELTPTIKSKKLTYTQKIQKLPKMSVDPKLLRIVLQNLLSNSVKYTPNNGTVKFTVREATREDISRAPTKLKKSPLVYFEVIDTGYGIPKEMQNRIFEKLYRADNVRRLDVEGTGLGLYIVREIVNMLGGIIWFESAENKGSKFYAIIPLKTTPSKDDTISKVSNG